MRFGLTTLFNKLIEVKKSNDENRKKSRKVTKRKLLQKNIYYNVFI